MVLVVSRKFTKPEERKIIPEHHTMENSEWACSNIAVALRIASRLKPRHSPDVSHQTKKLIRSGHRDTQPAAASSVPLPSLPQEEILHVVRPRLCCELCSSFASVLPCPLDCLSVVCQGIDCQKKSLYSCMPFQQVVGAISDENNQFLDSREFSPVEIGCGADGRVLLGSLRNAPVAVKVTRVPGGMAGKAASRRLSALYNEATLGASVRSRQDHRSALGATLVARLEGVAVVCQDSTSRTKVHDRGVHPPAGHTVVLVQRFYDLGSLDQLIHKRRRARGLSRSGVTPTLLMTERECTSLLTSVCMSLLFLHDEMHVVHRDVKPQNIFLASSDDACLEAPPPTRQQQMSPVSIVLGDMGLSREMSAVRTTCGTPKFMAPELVVSSTQHLLSTIVHGGSRPTIPQLEAPYGPPADIFSLGVTLQYTISGGVVEAVRRPWLLPSEASAPPSSYLRRSPRGAAAEGFTVPVSWVCFNGSTTSDQRCDCDKLHAPFIALMNRMIAPNPRLRPSAAEVLRDIASVMHSGVRVASSKLRDHLWNDATLGQLCDTCASLPLLTSADTMGNVSMAVVSPLMLNVEEMNSLRPARGAICAAKRGAVIVQQPTSTTKEAPRVLSVAACSAASTPLSSFGREERSMKENRDCLPQKAMPKCASLTLQEYFAFFSAGPAVPTKGQPAGRTAMDG